MHAGESRLGWLLGRGLGPLHHGLATVREGSASPGPAGRSGAMAVSSAEQEAQGKTLAWWHWSVGLLRL